MSTVALFQRDHNQSGYTIARRIMRNTRFICVCVQLGASASFAFRHHSVRIITTRHRTRFNQAFRRPSMLFSSQVTRTLESSQSHEAEMEVKKSRFIGYAQRVASWEEAQDYLHRIKQEHPKARHWCYGFRCGTNPVTERCSDDGEPTGTAGTPILGAIRGEDLSDVMCVVVRYFGGIKLGAGGLIRAYGAAARLVLNEAPMSVLIPQSSLEVKVDAIYIGAVYESASKHGATASEEEYGDDGSLTVTLTVDTKVSQELQRGLNDSTRGTAAVEIL